MSERASLALGLAMMACAGAAVYLALEWPWKAKLFPIAIGSVVFCLAAAEVAWGLFGKAAGERGMDFQISDQQPRGVARRRSLAVAGWMAGFFGAIVLLGFPLAVPLFVFVFLRFYGREPWRFSLVFSGAVWGAFYGIFDRLLHLPFPAGWLQGWLGLG